MDECELISLVTAIACAISKSCSTDDITIMSAVFSQLGDTLQTILTQRELKEDRTSSQKKDNSTDTDENLL